ncbi:hypothetical protein [Halosolutus gelatinilyticus]|uniref:hypothetical protein n=1 Tax=Halosolutus gelatinilyticus TaxID=2931975 RepID=UPI001FF44F13|nr:hypothetical protein [Halosolutus gelatinilyticus]
MLIALAIAIRVATKFVSLSLSHAKSFAAGAFLAGLVLIVAHLASWREIDGWRADESADAR